MRIERPLVKEAASLKREKVTANDKGEFEKIMKGARIDILGKSMSMRKLERAGYIQCRY